MQATLTVGHARRDVRVLDVSEHGIKLALPDGPPPDAVVVFSTPRLRRTAQVRWAGRGAVGLVLLEPLSPDEQGELAGMSWGSIA
jgi:hypothetical protein